MNISIDAKKKEAIKRLKKMRVHEEVIAQFEKENLINMSEPPFGACYWPSDDELAMIREFEQEHNAVVFHVVRSFMEFGVCDCYLFVSDYEEEWEQEDEYTKRGSAFVYVYNHDEPAFSEFGSVGIELTPAGGLMRTW